MRGICASLAALMMLLMSVVAQASPTACPSHYAGGEAPDIIAEQLNNKVREICKEAFGVFHSGVAAVPLWSAEHLTGDQVIRAKRVARVDRFFAEPLLPDDERGELEHYRGSGFDRGHLAPSANMPTRNAQEESFSLANIAPQTPNLNRRLWAYIEATVRGIALQLDEVYVVTGLSFTSAEVDMIGGRVLVPSVLWKAIYVPKAGMSSAWWAPNSDEGDAFEVISINELKRRSGIDVFPGVDMGIKQQAVSLPEPSPAYDRVQSN